MGRRDAYQAPPEIAPAASAWQEIIDKTLGEVRTFIDEISNNTANYRTIHSLTEQINHQYHGRFVIELLQNAHDALLAESRAQPRRILFRVIRDVHPHGVLLVANDGRPFRRENFLALARLGQSSKDFRDSVGNKGLGFRSVLEVCSAPEIYSRSARDSDGFDGYCFRFDPSGMSSLSALLRDLAAGADEVVWHLENGEQHPLRELRARRFREECQRRALDPAEEFKLLSPYLLPLPQEPTDPHVLSCAREGYSTVVRLPFNEASGLKTAEDRLAELTADTLIFLTGVDVVYVDDGAGTLRELHRSQRSKGARRTQVGVGDLVGADKQYWVWKRTVGGSDDLNGARRLKNAASKLPGRWPEIDEAIVSIAIGVSDSPVEGRFFIYLPTELPSGSSVHLNAPFYGDLSRKTVDFELPLNALLLAELGSLATSVILEELKGRNDTEARAIIDLCASPVGAIDRRWFGMLRPALVDEAVFITDKDWKAATSTRIIPHLPDARVLTETRLRRAAKFAAFRKSQTSRIAGARAIILALDGPLEPTDQELAATVEEVTRVTTISDWAGFWEDVQRLLPEKAVALRGRKVLLDNRGKLRASDGKVRIFFPRPQSDDDDDASLVVVAKVPDQLKSRVAFLSKEIPMRRKNSLGRWESSPTRKYLEGLVDTYRVETIIKQVLVPALPTGHVALDSKSAEVCKAILDFAIQLLLAAREDEGLVPLLSRLRLPCLGGWIPALHTVFGPGWPDADGVALLAFLDGAGTADALAYRDRLLLPPDAAEWSGHGPNVGAHLARKEVGVRSGLHPLEVAGDWKKTFFMARAWEVRIPEAAPPHIDDQQWKEYVDARARDVHGAFEGNFLYTLEDVRYLPGLSALAGLDERAQAAFSRLLIRSIPNWKAGWRFSSCRKQTGLAHDTAIMSFVAHALSHLPWLVDDAGARSSASGRWLVPSIIDRGQRHHFRHLNPLPKDLTALLLSEPKTVSELRYLGLSVLNLETQTEDKRLLVALADALAADRVDQNNRHVFLGQVRDAWGVFYPSSAAQLPPGVVVQRGPVLSTILPSPEHPIYVPDRGHGVELGVLTDLPILAAHPHDAARLLEILQQRFGEGVRSLRSVKLEALVGSATYVPRAERSRLLDSNLAWLVPMTLAIAAFGGPSPQGYRSERFKRAMAALRTISIEPVDELSVRIHGIGDETRHRQQSFWHADSQTLVFDSATVRWLESLAVPLQQVLDRSDLLPSLQLVLVKLEDVQEPDEIAVGDALATLRISAEQFAEVRHQITGDLEWTIERLLPALILLSPEFHRDQLADVESASVLEALLESLVDQPSAPQLLEHAREARDDADMGCRLFEKVGGAFELDQWNWALESLGKPYRRIRSLRCRDDFEMHRHESMPALRRIVAYLCRRGHRAERYVETVQDAQALPVPPTAFEKYWNLPFSVSLSALLSCLAAFKDFDDHDLLSEKDSVEALHAAIDAADSNGVDPIERHRTNLELCLRSLEALRRVAVLWCEDHKVPPGHWLTPPEKLFEATRSHLDGGHGYVDDLDEMSALLLLRERLPTEPRCELFWQLLEQHRSIEALRTRLGYSKERLASSDSVIARNQEAARRASRMMSVSGAAFDPSVSNLTAVWDHLSTHLADASLPDSDPSRESKLEKLPPRSPRTGSRSSGSSTPTHRLTDEQKRLIGLVGEIIAYRMLQRRFGERITPSCWVSENSLHRFPGNVVNDGLGYDFRIVDTRRIWHIEVKSSSGDDGGFELGSSEMRFAMEAAKQGKRFQILHIREALSGTPSAHFLPNPFGAKGHGLFSFDEAGMRVRYKTNL